MLSRTNRTPLFDRCRRQALRCSAAFQLKTGGISHLPGSHGRGVVICCVTYDTSRARHVPNSRQTNRAAAVQHGRSGHSRRSCRLGRLTGNVLQSILHTGTRSNHADQAVHARDPNRSVCHCRCCLFGRCRLVLASIVARTALARCSGRLISKSVTLRR